MLKQIMQKFHKIDTKLLSIILKQLSVLAETNFALLKSDAVSLYNTIINSNVQQAMNAGILTILRYEFIDGFYDQVLRESGDYVILGN